MGAPTRVRKLYTAETDAIAAFDGSEWRSFTPTGRGTVTVVGNGPYWGTSLGWFLATADDLASAPTEYDVTTNGEITAIWVHETQVGHVVVGTAAGTLYATPDGGATWGGPGGGSVGGGKFGPDGGNPDGSVPILQVIASIHDPNEWHVLTPTGWHRSPDAGASWTLVRAPATGQTPIALRLSGWRNLMSSTITAAGAVLEKGEDGTPFTFPDTPTGITGIAFNVFADEVCAISGDTPPKLYVTDAAGSYTMAAAEVSDLAGYTGAAPHPRNLQHDGSIARQVYAAVGDYALKSTDLFKTDSVHVLRHVGEGGAGAGPITMIGQGDLVAMPATPPGDNIIRTITFAWDGSTYLAETPSPVTGVQGIGTWQYGPSVYGPLTHPDELAEPENIAVWNAGFWFDIIGVGHGPSGLNGPTTPPPIASALTND
jgi:hypothetical protein